MKWGNIFLFSISISIIILLLITSVRAHVPLTAKENINLETATYIRDPLKSWAIYGELQQGGEAHYYRFNMKKDQRLRLLLFIPFTTSNGKNNNENNNTIFMPELAIMGPGIRSKEKIPDYVEKPEGAGVMVVAGKRPEQAVYEPFTPDSHYEIADLDMNISEDGTYYVAVYNPFQGGRYGLAIGYQEEFKVGEWIMVPVNIIRIHQWEGQSLAFILAPMVAIVIIGCGYIFWQRKKGNMAFYSSFGLLGSVAGFLYVGSGAIMLVQMLIALSRTALTSSVIITILLILLPLITGSAMMHVAMQAGGGREMKARLKMGMLGIVGLIIWAGLLIGPFLAILVNILPYSMKEKTNEEFDS